MTNLYTKDNIQRREKPEPDSMGLKERSNIASGNADEGEEKAKTRKWLQAIIEFNLLIMYAFVFLSGINILELNDSVLITLISGATGSSAVHFWKNASKYAYS